MPRPKPGRICPTNGCPNHMPCEQHAPQAWRDRDTRRPQALTGRALAARNARVIAAHAGICHVCGQPGANQVDHRIPYAEGGTDHPDNLRPIHPTPCHDTKTRDEAARGRQRTRDNNGVDWAD